MAAYLIPVQPSLIIRASTTTTTTTSGTQKPEPSQQRKSWWTPLFGWSSEPDYIDSTSNTDHKIKPNIISNSSVVSDSNLGRKTIKSRKSPATFTDEKARKLRMLTVETESFHDAMYHSAIASRLASDFSDRSD